jgi:hypothetical protein
MLLDYEIGTARRCVMGRAIAPGEEYCSTLEMERGAPARDYTSTRGPGHRKAWWHGGDRGLTAEHSATDLLRRMCT